jgi:hypothetical protein
MGGRSRPAARVTYLGTMVDVHTDMSGVSLERSQPVQPQLVAAERHEGNVVLLSWRVGADLKVRPPGSRGGSGFTLIELLW